LSAVLHWVGDKPRALAETRRVLRPGVRLGLWRPCRRSCASPAGSPAYAGPFWAERQRRDGPRRWTGVDHGVPGCSSAAGARGTTAHDARGGHVPRRETSAARRLL